VSDPATVTRAAWLEQDMSSKRQSRGSVKGFINTVVERVFGSEPAPVEKKMQNLAHKQAKIRAVSVRRGFQQIRARSDEMALRLEEYKRQRMGEARNQPIDAVADAEAIILTSDESESRLPERMSA
jgi:hypothetical protein